MKTVLKVLFALVNTCSFVFASNPGVVFKCGDLVHAGKVVADMKKLLEENGVTEFVTSELTPDGKLAYVLKLQGQEDGDTSILAEHPALKIESEEVTYSDSRGKEFTRSIVSKKEILLAMLTSGRVHTFSGKNCSVDALKEHIGARQNIVLWATHKKDWEFGSSAIHSRESFDEDWNLKSGADACEGLGNIFSVKERTRFGCTMACKMASLYGQIDFYNKVAPDEEKLRHFKALIAKDEWPVEQIQEYHVEVPEKHWVPGDWGWVENTKYKSGVSGTGTQGSNVISIGGGNVAGYWISANNKSLEQCIRGVRNWDGGAKVDPHRAIPKTFESISGTPLLTQRIMTARGATFPLVQTNSDSTNEAVVNRAQESVTTSPSVTESRREEPSRRSVEFATHTITRTDSQPNSNRISDQVTLRANRNEPQRHAESTRSQSSLVVSPVRPTSSSPDRPAVATTVDALRISRAGDTDQARQSESSQTPNRSELVQQNRETVLTTRQSRVNREQISLSDFSTNVRPTQSLRGDSNSSGGVFIDSVRPNSSATRAGIEQGMRITEFNGAPTRSMNELSLIMRLDRMNRGEGNTNLSLQNERQGQSNTRSVIVGPNR